MVGTLQTAAEVAEIVLKDRIFYEHSGGGVTVSGGEPLMQAEFTYSLLSILRTEGIHTVLQTCGQGSSAWLSKIAAVTDLILFDYKESDDGLHKNWTGVSQDQILANLELLAVEGVKVVLRCPIIPDLNDHSDHFAGIAKIAARMPNIEHVELLPYHNYGLEKAMQVGVSQRKNLRVPSHEEVLTWRDAVLHAGYDNVLISSVS